MWYKEYRDYPPDTPVIQYPVEPSHGIIGCEMHEINGWGNSLHIKKNKSGFLHRLWKLFFGTRRTPEE